MPSLGFRRAETRPAPPPGNTKRPRAGTGRFAVSGPQYRAAAQAEVDPLPGIKRFAARRASVYAPRDRPENAPTHEEPPECPNRCAARRVVLPEKDHRASNEPDQQGYCPHVLDPSPPFELPDDLLWIALVHRIFSACARSNNRFGLPNMDPPRTRSQRPVLNAAAGATCRKAVEWVAGMAAESAAAGRAAGAAPPLLPPVDSSDAGRSSR